MQSCPSVFFDELPSSLYLDDATTLAHLREAHSNTIILVFMRENTYASEIARIIRLAQAHNIDIVGVRALNVVFLKGFEKAEHIHQQSLESATLPYAEECQYGLRFQPGCILQMEYFIRYLWDHCRLRSLKLSMYEFETGAFEASLPPMPLLDDILPPMLQTKRAPTVAQKREHRMLMDASAEGFRKANQLLVALGCQPMPALLTHQGEMRKKDHALDHLCLSATVPTEGLALAKSSYNQDEWYRDLGGALTLGGFRGQRFEYMTPAQYAQVLDTFLANPAALPPDCLERLELRAFLHGSIVRPMCLTTSRRLKQLDLCFCSIDDVAFERVASVLIQTYLPELTELKLARNLLCACDLGETLAALPTLSDLDVSHNPIVSIGLSRLLRGMHSNTRLTNLDFSNCSYLFTDSDPRLVDWSGINEWKGEHLNITFPLALQSDEEAFWDIVMRFPTGVDITMDGDMMSEQYQGSHSNALLLSCSVTEPTSFSSSSVSQEEGQSQHGVSPYWRAPII